MRRMAMGMMSVALGLASLTSVHAQSTPSGERTSPWSWLTTKKGGPPPKPSADPAPSRSPTSSAASTPHVLRQTTCNIPFTVDPSKTSPVELQLYVSQDRGANWKFFAKATPAAGHFSFRAANDGEYWFALRSVEKTAAPVDLKQLIPGLKVVFDTRDPELRFDAAIHGTGEVRASWSVRDATLVSESLKIEYQAHAKAPWQLVSIPTSSPGPDGMLVGSFAWTPDPASDGLLVRAEISDRAGNKTVVSRRLMSRQTANGQPSDGFRARTGPATTYPVAQEGQSWPVDNQLPVSPQSPPVAPHGDLPPPKPAVEPPPTTGREPVRNPYISTQKSLLTKESSVPPDNAAASSPEEEIAPVVGPANQAQTSELPSAPADTTATERSRSVPDSSHIEVQQPAAPLAVPNGERPRMTHARQFSLDYEIDSLGPTGVAKVELWGTNNGGRTWTHWQDDADRQSPLDLVVDQDGIFGFRIVILGTNQLAGAPPQPGDPADLWVGVDTAKPTVRLTSAMYGEGEHAGQLDVRWQAIDVWFTERPITLLFSEHPQGPWSTIAAGLPNTGQYNWPVEPRIPRHIYLRIEARDEAGNVGEHQIQEAINTGGLVPQGRIRGLRATTTSPTSERSAARGG